MNAIISNGDYTAIVQLPVDRKQLAGALSYLGKNHASAYDIYIVTQLRKKEVDWETYYPIVHRIALF